MAVKIIKKKLKWDKASLTKKVEIGVKSQKLWLKEEIDRQNVQS